MKQVIFLSMVFAFLSFSVNNEEVLAAGAPPPAGGPTPPPAAGPTPPPAGGPAPPPAGGPAPPPGGSPAPPGGATPAPPPGANSSTISPKDPRFVLQKYCIAPKCNPTVLPAPAFEAKKDASTMAIALDDMGSPSILAIINVLSKRGNIQRLEIIEAYKTMYNKDMFKKVRDETHGAFRAVLSGLLTPLPSYIAKELHDNINQKGTDGVMLVEHLCSLSNFGIKSIAEFYQTMFSKPLEDDIRAETTGSFQKVMMSSVQGKREENPKLDNAKAVADAQTLHKTKGPTWLAETSEFNTIFANRSFVQLKQIMVEYKKIAKHDIDVDIQKEFKGPEATGLSAFARCARSKDEFIADRLYRSMKGLGTKEATLTRIVVSRCDLDLGDIKTAYHALYKKSLEGWVADDISADYKDIMLPLIKGTAK